jgi:uncharacterized protein YpmB
MGYRKILFYVSIFTILLLLIILTFIIVTSYIKNLFRHEIKILQLQPIQEQTIIETYTTTETSTTSLVTYKIQNEEKVKQDNNIIITTTNDIKTHIKTQQMIMYSTLIYFGISDQNAKQIVKATFEELPNIEKYGFTYEDVIALIYLESTFRNRSPYWDNNGEAVGYFSIHNVVLDRVKKQYPKEFGHIKNNRELLKSPYYQTKVSLRYIYIIIQSEVKDPKQHHNIKCYALSRYNGRTTNLYNNTYIRVFNDRLSQVKLIIQRNSTILDL